ncbi:unnamed protein product [Protopolystoma xenopodis]|uniref:Uncharacterized protein n=1 Tax=Protopolystoma xenopodis TaxID=117903 RepID=A0A3S5B6E6_9PLAT|nr:unnamed protein product [Protopolystoma xenopodis]
MGTSFAQLVICAPFLPDGSGPDFSRQIPITDALSSESVEQTSSTAGSGASTLAPLSNSLLPSSRTIGPLSAAPAVLTQAAKLGSTESNQLPASYLSESQSRPVTLDLAISADRLPDRCTNSESIPATIEPPGLIDGENKVADRRTNLHFDQRTRNDSSASESLSRTGLNCREDPPLFSLVGAMATSTSKNWACTPKEDCNDYDTLEPVGAQTGPTCISAVSPRIDQTCTVGQPLTRYMYQFGQSEYHDPAFDRRLSNNLIDFFRSQWHRHEHIEGPQERSKTIALVQHSAQQMPTGAVIHRATCVQQTCTVRLSDRWNFFIILVNYVELDCF